MEATNVNSAVNNQTNQFNNNDGPVHARRKSSVYVSSLNGGSEHTNGQTSTYHHRERVNKSKMLEPLEVRRKKSLYVGNLDTLTTEDNLYRIFCNFARVVDVKVHRSETSTYGFVQFESEDLAHAAMNVMDGTPCLGRALRVRWSGTSSSSQLSVDALSDCFNVYVKNVSRETTSESLKIILSSYGEVVTAKVVNCPNTMQSMGYAFVYFRCRSDAERLINEIREMWIDDRNVKFSWAFAGSRKDDENYQYEEGRGDGAWSYIKENLNYWNVLERGGNSCSVYIGNLPPFNDRNDILGKLEHIFWQFGEVRNIKLFPGKLYAFVEFGTREEAANAITNAHGTILEGRRMRCFWGREHNVNGDDKAVTETSPTSEENLVHGFQPDVQSYDHQSFINAPLQHENHLQNGNPGYFYGGYSNDFNHEAHNQAMQQLPYQSEVPMGYYSMPIMPMQQPVWHPNQITAEQMWTPVPADGSTVPNHMYVGAQEPYSYGPGIGVFQGPHPDYNFWHPESTDGTADYQNCEGEAVENEATALDSLRNDEADEDQNESADNGQGIKQNGECGINPEDFDSINIQEKGQINQSKTNDSTECDIIENGPESPEN